jgi:hypothetical protein
MVRRSARILRQSFGTVRSAANLRLALGSFTKLEYLILNQRNRNTIQLPDFCQIGNDDLKSNIQVLTRGTSVLGRSCAGD